MKHRCSFLLAGLACALVLQAQAPSEVRSALIDGRPTAYEVKGGYGVVQGDILIGPVREIDALRLPPQEKNANAVAQIFTFSFPAQWPAATMYYVIDPDVPNPSRILAAIDHWNTRTPLTIVPRSTEANYVRFRRADPGNACTSYVGMIGNAQPILLEDACSIGNVIHEIGHAFGLLHEQARNDRNANVTVLFENIDKRLADNFVQNVATTKDQGYYDFDSIMHYGFRDFSSNGGDTIDSVPLGIPFGQRTRLSAGDIDGISRLYGFIPVNTTITTIPEGLPVVVDGVPAISPVSFPWVVGSTHSISVAAESGTDPRYRLAKWSDGGDATHNVTASAARTVFAAVFQRLRQFSVTAPAGGGTVSIFPSIADGYYPERMPVRITATPAPGNKLYTWNGQPSLQNNGYGLASQTAVLEVASSVNQLTAVFSNQVLTTIDSQPRGRIVQVDNSNYVTPVKFIWVSGTTHTLSLQALQTATGSTSRYRFDTWEDGSNLTFRSVTAGSSDTTFQAKFTAQYLLGTSTLGPGSISISPPSSDGFYEAGADVQLAALPNNGFTFQAWMGDLLGDAPAPTLKMDQPKNVLAGFGSPIPFFALNAGTYQFNPVFTSGQAAVAPGEILAIFSHNAIGPNSQTPGQVQGGKVTTDLDSTQVLFDLVPAPMLLGQSNFLQAVVPASVSGKAFTQVRVIRNGSLVGGAGLIAVQETFPGIFTADASGKGQIAAVNQDLSLNSPASPAAPQSIVSFYMTGGGLPETPVADGQVMGSDLVRLKAPVYARVGKHPAEVIYAGSIPTLVNGALLVQVRLPKELIGGSAVPIQVIFGNYASPPGTTIAVQ